MLGASRVANNASGFEELTNALSHCSLFDKPLDPGSHYGGRIAEFRFRRLWLTDSLHQGFHPVVWQRSFMIFPAPRGQLLHT